MSSDIHYDTPDSLFQVSAPDGDAEPEAAESELATGEFEPEDDVQLARAVEVLKSWTYFERLREEPSATSLQARASDTP